MTENSYEKDDEINLSELFITLWCHKVWITIVTSIFIFFSGYYALTTTKQYTATAIFEIEQSNSSGLNIPSEIGVRVTCRPEQRWKLEFRNSNGTDTREGIYSSSRPKPLSPR